MVTFNSSVPGTVFAASFHNPPELYDCFLNLFHVQLLPAATKLGQGNIFTGVCLSTGGVCLSACWDIPTRSRHPPGGRLQHTVNERPVRILLECILVYYLFYGFVYIRSIVKATSLPDGLVENENLCSHSAGKRLLKNRFRVRSM